MTSSGATVAGGLLGLAAVGGATALGTVLARRDRPSVPHALAVALDGPRDPLAAALRHGFAGIELGVRLDTAGPAAAQPTGALLRLTGAAYVGDPGATLDRLVITPLAERVKPTVHGWVYPQRPEPFLLLLHHDGALDAGVAAYAALETLLCRHASMFTRCVGGRVTAGSVTVVLTGPHWPRPLLAAAYERYAFVEGDLSGVAAGDPLAGDPLGGDLLSGDPLSGDAAELPSVAPLVSEAFAARLGWDPRERWVELPAEARHILRSLVRAAHDDGRQVRFVDVPDRPRRVRLGLWRELRAAGVDYIGSRHVGALARFLRAHSNPATAAGGPQ